jgi:hypothetical protein
VAWLNLLLHNCNYFSAAVGRNIAKLREYVCACLDLPGGPTLNRPAIGLERRSHMLDPVARCPKSASNFTDPRSGGAVGRRRPMVGPMRHPIALLLLSVRDAYHITATTSAARNTVSATISANGRQPSLPNAASEVFMPRAAIAMTRHQRDT